MRRPVVGLAVLTLVLCACVAAPAASPSQPPERTGYVLSGYNVGGGFAHNALTIFDATTWRVHRRIDLPRSWAKHLARDPAGRLWVGFSGTMRQGDTRLDVYGPSGDLVRTLHPCTDPEAGITFAAGRAFVACAEDGFRGKLAVVSLDTLAVEQSVDLGLPDSHLLLLASAADEATVVVAGATGGSDEARYAAVILVDPRSLAITARLPLGRDTDVWRILPHAGRFYLLNVGSWRRPLDRAQDLLLLEPGDPPRLTPIALAPSPLWGAIDGDALYAYHNPTWNQANRDPRRRLSRLDLVSGAVREWPLPDSWNASDLTTIDGRVVLAWWGGRSGPEDGLYRFDPASGQLAQQMSLVDASGVLGPLP